MADVIVVVYRCYCLAQLISLAFKVISTNTNSHQLILKTCNAINGLFVQTVCVRVCVCVLYISLSSLQNGRFLAYSKMPVNSHELENSLNFATRHVEHHLYSSVSCLFLQFWFLFCKPLESPAPFCAWAQKCQKHRKAQRKHVREQSVRR